MTEALTYLHGFGNYFESENIPNVLIAGRNSPQKVPYGLFTEQLSGSAFTQTRAHNHASWLYRILPSVMHDEFLPMSHPFFVSPPFEAAYTPPTQMRWSPLPYPSKELSFIEGLVTLAGNGSPELRTGSAIHLYVATRSMQDEYFYNADGELLIVPQEGSLLFKTELGILQVKPGEIIVIPRGIKWQAHLLEEKVRGYVCENFGQPFKLPELGVIGANGLAHPMDFKIPTAAFEERQGHFKLFAKFQGQLWEANLNHSPLNVVAWRGNYVPYKYDLSLFNAVNSVGFDHMDPSIFSVLTSPSAIANMANLDFVIFPPRWVVAEDTFRPPYFHRNVMSEYMGLIHGQYDGKENGFIPGGSSLHNTMTGHGPDAEVYAKAIEASQTPTYYGDTLAFMFESQYVFRITPFAHNADFRQKDYLSCWQGLTSHFNPFSN